MPKIHMQTKYRCHGPTSEKVESHHVWKNSTLCAEQSTWRAGSILHTQWAMFLWEKCVSMGSGRSEDMFLQAPLLLPASKVTLSLDTLERSPSKASNCVGIQ